jgi:hypothetical protein
VVTLVTIRERSAIRESERERERQDRRAVQRKRMEKRIDKREPVVRFSTRLGGDDDDGRLDKMKTNEI